MPRPTQAVSTECPLCLLLIHVKKHGLLGFLLRQANFLPAPCGDLAINPLSLSTIPPRRPKAQNLLDLRPNGRLHLADQAKEIQKSLGNKGESRLRYPAGTCSESGMDSGNKINCKHVSYLQGLPFIKLFPDKEDMSR